jgi:hypothetical protein
MFSGNETPRYQVENLGMSTQITIPAKKNWFTLIFMSVWLTGWLFGELFALGILITSVGGLLGRSFGLRVFEFFEFFMAMGGAFVGIFVLIWLVTWTVGGYSALRTFLWQLAGKEVIEASHDGMRLSRSIFGLGRVKEYEANEIADVRLLGSDGRTGKKNIAGPNQLAFDYGFGTVEFGGGLTPEEAKEILEEITKRYREYAPEPKE